MNKPEIWAIVGGNGAGKPTFYKNFLEPQGIPFINADIIAREIAPENPEAASYVAAELAAQQRDHAIKVQQNFCFETVFSHPSKIDLLTLDKAATYEINLVVIYVTDTEINKARIKQRVSEGGHDVPKIKLSLESPELTKILPQLSTSVIIFTFLTTAPSTIHFNE